MEELEFSEAGEKIARLIDEYEFFEENYRTKIQRDRKREERKQEQLADWARIRTNLDKVVIPGIPTFMFTPSHLMCRR